MWAGLPDLDANTKHVEFFVKQFVTELRKKISLVRQWFDVSLCT